MDRHFLLPLLVAVGVLTMVAAASQTGRPEPPPQSDTAAESAAVRHLNEILAERWDAYDITSGQPADDLTILRRLSLVLHGTVPSLEEIRRFQSDNRSDRLSQWAAAMTRDVRFGRYWSERIARATVGNGVGPFVVFRRDRFKYWLAEQIHQDRPWDQTVARMIDSEGVWTDTPAVNFVTQAIANDDLDEAELTARTVRAFLGQRIDCAQCHDHPFDDWKQTEFEGLAAHFGQAGLSIGGMTEDREKTYEVIDAVTAEERTVDPGVPFGEEWWPAEGTRRHRLAVWVTHPANVRFDRAIANRVWTLMMGRPFLQDRPVDDLPDPENDSYAEDLAALDLLAEDFRLHDRRLSRLVEVIAASDAFRMSSADPRPEDEVIAAEEVWAVRPLTRLRPEQVIGSMIQAASVRTIDPNSHLFVRFLRLIRENDFVKDFGDAGEQELEDRSGTIPQALLRMNGKLSRELSEATPATAAGRVAMVQQDPKKLVQTAYLVCLTREPTAAERDYFASLLIGKEGNARERVVQDLFWALFNSEEFSWLH